MSTKTRAAEAFDLLKQGREKEARVLLEKIVEDDLADAAVLETLGDVREKLGDKSGAIDAYAGAVMHLRARTELRRALGVLELMLIVDDACVWARKEAASIRREQGDFASAWREVLAACDIFIRDKKPGLAMSLAREYADVLADAGPALDLVQRLVLCGEEHRRGIVELCVHLGHALRTRDKSDDALALYARGLDIDPDSQTALHARAGALISTGRPAEARVIVERLLSLYPEDLVALTLLERCALSQGDEATAKIARQRFDGATNRLDKDREADETRENVFTEDSTQEHAVDDDPTDVER
jgi:tetratricopeptide (TPR) repeat protein